MLKSSVFPGQPHSRQAWPTLARAGSQHNCSEALALTAPGATRSKVHFAWSRLSSTSSPPCLPMSCPMVLAFPSSFSSCAFSTFCAVMAGKSDRRRLYCSHKSASRFRLRTPKECLCAVSKNLLGLSWQILACPCTLGGPRHGQDTTPHRLLSTTSRTREYWP